MTASDPTTRGALKPMLTTASAAMIHTARGTGRNRLPHPDDSDAGQHAEHCRGRKEESAQRRVAEHRGHRDDDGAPCERTGRQHDQRGFASSAGIDDRERGGEQCRDDDDLGDAMQCIEGAVALVGDDLRATRAVPRTP